ncbi:hypothetical protein ALC62_06383, partial [Cyphomyrmex costatus]
GIAFAVNPNGEKRPIQIQMLIDPAVDPLAFRSSLYLLVETGDRGESYLILKARKASHSVLTLRGTQTHTHTHTHNMQDLPRHQHSDPRLSVSFQSQTRWMAGEWKSWLKPNPIPLLPSTVRERPSILFATTLMPRGPPPPRYSTLRSRIILLRVSPFPKYKYIMRIYSLCIYIMNKFLESTVKGRPAGNSSTHKEAATPAERFKSPNSKGVLFRLNGPIGIYY